MAVACSASQSIFYVNMSPAAEPCINIGPTSNPRFQDAGSFWASPLPLVLDYNLDFNLNQFNLEEQTRFHHGHY